MIATVCVDQQCFLINIIQLTCATLVGPLILSHDLGPLQTPQQVYDQESLTDEACSEPTIHVIGFNVIQDSTG